LGCKRLIVDEPSLSWYDNPMLFNQLHFDGFGEDFKGDSKHFDFSKVKPCRALNTSCGLMILEDRLSF